MFLDLSGISHLLELLVNTRASLPELRERDWALIFPFPYTITQAWTTHGLPYTYLRISSRVVQLCQVGLSLRVDAMQALALIMMW